MQRAFGIAGGGGQEFLEEIAWSVEQAGFSRLWINDTPTSDGIEAARVALSATAALRVGIGVSPLDRRPPAEIAQALGNLDHDRLIAGVGAGLSASPLKTVAEGVSQLRNLDPELKVAVGAMGARMCRLAGEIADIVLLNWMTPARIVWARPHIEEGIKNREPSTSIEVAAYVRLAAEPNATKLIASEAGNYHVMPHYGAHFEAMGVPLAEVGVVAGDEARLGAYEEVLDEVVARALPSNPRSLSEVLELARLAAPLSSL